MLKTKKFFPVCIATVGILVALLLGGFFTDNAVDVMVEKHAITQRHCVIIDAGHGGVDGGAVSCTGIKESQLNLQIALRLNDLMHLLGIQTSMIRKEDVSIYTNGNTIAAKKVSDLKERVKIVNQTNNGILISIHQNYFENAQYRGAQAFYYTDSELASQLQTAFVKTINPGSQRKVKKANNIYLLQHVNCPAALIECGFLSNPAEEANLRSAEYQKRICCIISSVLSCYIHNDDVA